MLGARPRLVAGIIMKIVGPFPRSRKMGPLGLGFRPGQMPTHFQPRWSLQNRPTVVSAKPANGMAQDLVLLSRFLLIGQACFGPPAPRPTFKDMAVVEKAVEHSGDRGAVAKQFAPVFHRAVGS